MIAPGAYEPRTTWVIWTVDGRPVSERMNDWGLWQFVPVDPTGEARFDGYGMARDNAIGLARSLERRGDIAPGWRIRRRVTFWRDGRPFTEYPRP